MRSWRIIGIAIMFLVLPVLAGAEGLGNARLSLMDGDVQIKPEDSSDWIPASINMPLREGDRIWVPDRGKAEVQLASGSQIRLDELSAIEILNLDRDSAQFYVSAGSAYVNFMAGRERAIQIDTPLSSVRAYDRAAFGVDVQDDGMTDVSVYQGSLTAETSSGTTRVSAGRMLSLSDRYADMAPLGRQDDWERWNMDRDRRFADRRYASSRYLPDELDTYASDFDDNGRWVNAPGYGTVWTPTVSVSVGWSPYRNGRWCWVGGDYVWVGYEPWGWAPYHYGRWAFAPAIGWFWVPPVRGSVYWGPGFVGWVSTPTYVAWVPLAPGETYYGHGYYGPNSVNIVNVNVNKIVVKKVYKNVYVNNGVTVVHHDTFVKGRQVDYKVGRNPFLENRVHIGRPDIRPVRETRMPVIREIPRAKEPPQRIREVKVRELKAQRPFVRSRDQSVFSPNAPERRLNVKAVEKPQERRRFREDTKKGVRQEDQGGRSMERQPAERDRKIGPAERQQPDTRSPEGDRKGMQKRQTDRDRDNDSNDRFPPDRLKERSRPRDVVPAERERSGQLKPEPERAGRQGEDGTERSRRNGDRRPAEVKQEPRQGRNAVQEQNSAPDRTDRSIRQRNRAEEKERQKDAQQEKRKKAKERQEGQKQESEDPQTPVSQGNYRAR